MTTVTITIPNEKPLRWIKFYARRHWSNRKAEAYRVHALVRAFVDPDSEPFDGPVYITITSYFKGRTLDPDNICSKLYIDGLKGWVIADDNRRHVRGVRSVSEVDRKNPRLVIEVRAAE
jgi:hypothetical protein